MSRTRTIRGVLVTGALTLGGMMLVPGMAAAQDEATPTYAKDVAPIFRAKCENCHRPGYIAPMSLQSYAESRPWARSIKNRVETRQMPPWHIDKSVGIQAFQNDRSLTNTEIDTIVRWVDAGAPRGNPADLPPPAVFADDDVWNFAERFDGPPDLVLHSTPYTMPALAQDAWWKPEVPTGLTEDRWIRAIEIRPSTVAGRPHHPPRPGAAAAGRGPRGSRRRLGSRPRHPDGVGGRQAGRDHARGQRQAHQGRLEHRVGHPLLVGRRGGYRHRRAGAVFHPQGQEPKHRQVLSAWSTIEGGSDHLSIPPNAVTATENYHVLKQNGRIENYQPHMHLRARACR